MNVKALEAEAAKIIAEYSRLPLNEMHLGTLLPYLWQLLKEHKLNFDTHLIWLLKAVATGEDIAWIEEASKALELEPIRLEFLEGVLVA